MTPEEFKKGVFSHTRSQYEQMRAKFIPHIMVLSLLDLRGRAYSEPGVSMLLLEPILFGSQEGVDMVHEFARARAKDMKALCIGIVATGAYIDMGTKKHGSAINIIYQEAGKTAELWNAGIAGDWGDLEEFSQNNPNPQLDLNFIPVLERLEVN